MSTLLKGDSTAWGDPGAHGETREVDWEGSATGVLRGEDFEPQTSDPGSYVKNWKEVWVQC